MKPDPERIRIKTVRTKQCCGAEAGLFWWRRSRWKGAGSLRWQRCGNSYNFSQIITIVTYTFRKVQLPSFIFQNWIWIFFIICVANFFSRSRELEPQTEPVARPGAGDGQSWTGSKTLGPRDPNPTNNGTGTAQRDKSKNWFWVRQATLKIIPVTFSEKNRYWKPDNRLMLPTYKNARFSSRCTVSVLGTRSGIESGVMNCDWTLRLLYTQIHCKQLGCGSAFILSGSGSSSFSQCGLGSGSSWVFF